MSGLDVALLATTTALISCIAYHAIATKRQWPNLEILEAIAGFVVLLHVVLAAVSGIMGVVGA